MLLFPTANVIGDTNQTLAVESIVYYILAVMTAVFDFIIVGGKKHHPRFSQLSRF